MGWLALYGLVPNERRPIRPVKKQQTRACIFDGKIPRR